MKQLVEVFVLTICLALADKGLSPTVVVYKHTCIKK